VSQKDARKHRKPTVGSDRPAAHTTATTVANSGTPSIPPSADAKQLSTETWSLWVSYSTSIRKLRWRVLALPTPVRPDRPMREPTGIPT
jgi:hypothetical protein